MHKRTQENVDTWKEIGASDTILRWVREGFDIVFEGDLPNLVKVGPNHPTARRVHQKCRKDKEQRYIEDFIAKNLKRGSIRLAKKGEDVCICPCSVVPKHKSTKEKFSGRLIWDGTYVNAPTKKYKFVYETLLTHGHVIRRGDILFTIDLKSGYYQIALHKGSAKYCGFQYDGCTYVYNVMPMGLSPVPSAFTKIMQQVARHFRAKGFRLIQYVDDWLFIASSMEEALKMQEYVLLKFRQLGLTVNYDKSMLKPATVTEFLGFEIDTDANTIKITKLRKDKIVTQAKQLLQKLKVNMRSLAQFTGRIISGAFAFGRVALLHCRAMFHVMKLQLVETVSDMWHQIQKVKRAWRGQVELTTEAKEEIKFWQENITKFNGSPIFYVPGVSEKT